MIKKLSIAVVLLNYNTEEDLFVSVEQISRQIGIDLITIVVDNASSSKCVKNIKSWATTFDLNAFSSSKDEIFGLMENNNLDKKSYKTFFIYNHENKGYSAGNNIGIRIADYLDVDAVLIANPDMRFENENYVYELTKTLFSNDTYAVASSKIIGLDGKDQSPLREANFYEELLWPKMLFPRIFNTDSYILSYDTDKITTVPKVMGCCLMLKMDFLRTINYFDENTFLYCEEPILSAQIKAKNNQIIFNPKIEAIHAHKASEKGNSSKRMLLFIKSRKYYLKQYSGYNQIQLMLLNFSYAVLAILHYIKSKVRK